MDDLFWVLLAIAIGVGAVIMPWVNMTRINRLRREMDGLLSSMQVQGIAAIPPAPVVQKETPQAPAAPETVIASPTPKPATVPSPRFFSKTEKPKPVQKTEKDKSGFEFNLAAKLPVWIGAISIICAGFFLVRYSIEQGWLGPAMRVFIGALFGGALVALGDKIAKRINIDNHDRIAQGLVSAGTVTLYVCAYAAANLYSLIPQFAGFIVMSAITALAVFMSLRHGKVIAMFGVIGGLATPALLATGEANAIGLFSYLFLLFCGLFYALAKMRWWKLAGVVMGGMFLWAAFWFDAAFRSADAMVFLLFGLGCCAAALFITTQVAGSKPAAEDKNPVRSLNVASIAGATLMIMAMGSKMHLSYFDWSMLGLLTLATMGLGFYDAKTYSRAIYAKLLADLILFMTWSRHVPVETAALVASATASIYLVAPYFVMRKVQDPRLWAGVQVFAATGFYLLSYICLHKTAAVLLPQGFWGIIALALAGLAFWQTQDMRKTYNADASIQDHLVGTYAVGVTGFVSLALAIELPWSYIPTAFAAQVAAMMWICKRTSLERLKPIAFWLTIAFIVMNYKQILLFTSLIVMGMFGDAPTMKTVAKFTLENPLFSLAMPALFLGLAQYFHHQAGQMHNKLAKTLLATSFLSAIAALYYIVRMVFNDFSAFSFTQQAGFIESGIFTILTAAIALAGMYHAKFRGGSQQLGVWSTRMFNIVMLRTFWIHMVLFNADKHQVGDWVLLNGITLVYGGVLAMLLFSIHKKLFAFGKFYKVFAIALLFVFVTMHVRQFFHGSLLESGLRTSTAELYGYSIAWLLTSLTLLGYGIQRQSRSARMAALAFMILTIGKVFLFDAAELEGLLRIFSFLGLGVSLIGLSFFYTRFVRTNETKEG